MIQYEIIEDPGLETEIFFAFIASLLGLGSGIVFHILLISRLWNRNRDASLRSEAKARGSEQAPE